MSSNDAWLLYADTRDRLIAMVRPLDTAQAAMVVPITPGWSIAAVVAHVCGLNADIAAGMREG
ncbi:MAG: maleylpyruvate isomerase N-terminal domain-containing protein, partial [Acidimicrobiales bacterium]